MAKPKYIVEAHKEALTRLERCHTGDTEHDHGEAVEALCDFLKSLGYKDVVEEFDKVPSW